jgi:acyl carrier protein
MPTTPSIQEIEDFLLGLVARDRGISIEDVRAEGVRCPYDAPWSSEDFVHYQMDIEEHFGIDIDPIEVEKVQRSVTLLAEFIRKLVIPQIERTA